MISEGFATGRPDGSAVRTCRQQKAAQAADGRGAGFCAFPSGQVELVVWRRRCVPPAALIKKPSTRGGQHFGKESGRAVPSDLRRWNVLSGAEPLVDRLSPLCQLSVNRDWNITSSTATRCRVRWKIGR